MLKMLLLGVSNRYIPYQPSDRPDLWGQFLEMVFSHFFHFFLALPFGSPSQLDKALNFFRALNFDKR